MVPNHAMHHILLFWIFSRNSFWFVVMSDLLKNNIFITMTQRGIEEIGAELDEWDGVIPLSRRANIIFKKYITFICTI